ncbi:hypothetical protein K437DRAFT_259466 [Tilletiaria anomala UBC 951]|uniref:Pre-mRNA-splicing factor CWC2 n=1 Tax=Tilletiaria anomala (strain ATCC 24038 / CBS 436.72 / UBC 951) TaxID=1037660 RepID=A0A066VHQ0_TILAU|nr:uncharacterized protein K437DRAFT_259466 [Tilletiaria anomala UBC 951]KDN38269.1 hypothetical protein K437DRAFT_259466 [Tilletiaria anomala UBC 951]
MNAHKKRKTAGGAVASPTSRSPSPVDSDNESGLASPSKAGQMPSTGTTASMNKPRPARKQITPEGLEAIKAAADKSAQSGVTYNLWYNKWAGGDSYDAAANNRKAETRCDISRDSGYTRGDINGGAYVCLFFARGYCPLGADCTYLHRLPPPIPLPDQGRDIFGREKHGDYRDDMGGVGSLQRVNRTLYIGRVHEEPRLSGGGGATNGVNWRDSGRTAKGGKSAGGKGGSLMKHSYDDLSLTEKVLWRHFSEWGEIERIRILHGRGCGFVTYKTEAGAQFAKEAMSHQSLDHDEILNVRWATEDPNPGAKKEHHRTMVREGVLKMAEMMTEEQREAGEAIKRLEGESGIREDRLIENIGQRRGRHNDDPEDEAKRRRLEEEDAADAMQRLLEENARGWAEIEGAKEQQSTPLQASAARGVPQTVAPSAKGLLSSDALSRLHQLKSMQAVASKKKEAGLSSLAAYGSDSEDE